MHTLVIRQLFKDRLSLDDYLAGRWPEVGVVRRRALVNEWAMSSQLPDHVLRNARDGVLGDAAGVWPIIKAALALYAERFLCLRGDRTHAVFDTFGEWQGELAFLSPLPFIAWHLYQRVHLPAEVSSRTLADFASRHLGQFRHTALVTPFCQVLDDLIARDGLNDLHIHLNGSTEVDKLWQDGLKALDRMSAELLKSLPDMASPANADKEMLAELYEQIGLTPRRMVDALLVARRLRQVMAGQVGGQRPATVRWRRLFDTYAVAELDGELPTDLHPLDPLAAEGRVGGRLVQEILLLMLVYHRLDHGGGEDLARALHAYLLILNAAFVPVAVQGAHQRGFDQFQKFTFAEVRSLSEKEYAERFHQLAGGLPGSLALLEGRFAPPGTFPEIIAMVRRIVNGLALYRWEAAGRHGERPPPVDLVDGDIAPQPKPDEKPRMELRLVCHLVKRRDEKPPWRDGELWARCRHAALRVDVARRWRLLRRAREEYRVVGRFVSGLDAAANELHAPPEVFAPVYRDARRSGLVHFTYHVGEDFEHLIGGLRAIREALEFLDLRDGNRLGHATAVGIDPALWLRHMPARLRRRRGDILDDLVFAHRLLLGHPDHAHVVATLEDEILTLSADIYGERVPPNLLWAAWQLRRLDPLQFEHVDDPERWSPLAAEMDERRELALAKKESRQAFALFMRYHSGDVVRRWCETGDMDAARLEAPLLRILQEEVLKEIVRRRVVIETLPTSNVRISFYRDHSEHHLFRWLAEPAGTRPQVCIGSDDPGIFATNLTAEVFHVYRELQQGQHANEAWQARDIVGRINEVGRVFGFVDQP